MCKIAKLLGLMWLFAGPVLAQDTPRAEVFGGYSYFRPEGGGANFNGWNAQVAGNLNNWFSLVGDFSGHYASPSGVDLSAHFFTGGPRVSYRKDSFTVFGHALVGGARVSAAGISDSGFGAIIGGGMDWNAGRRVAVRVFQGDYAVENTFGSTSHHFRASFGVVFRFGK